MEQTAVEWLYEQMPKKIQPHYKKQLEQAKEMEKEQIIDAVYYNVSSMTHDDLPAGESYYNRRFKPYKQLN
jgi:hypothetical protein